MVKQTEFETDYLKELYPEVVGIPPHKSPVHDPGYIELRSRVIPGDAHIGYQIPVTQGVNASWKVLDVVYSARFTLVDGIWTVRLDTPSWTRYMNHTSMVNDPEYIHMRSQIMHGDSRILYEAETSTGIYVKWSLLGAEYTAHFIKEGGEWSVEF